MKRAPGMPAKKVQRAALAGAAAQASLLSKQECNVVWLIHLAGADAVRPQVASRVRLQARPRHAQQAKERKFQEAHRHLLQCTPGIAG
jgi:hypothetical protein